MGSLSDGQSHLAVLRAAIGHLLGVNRYSSAVVGKHSALTIHCPSDINGVSVPVHRCGRWISPESIPHGGDRTLMGPGQDAFNHVFSSARIEVEQAWGMMVNRFRILAGKLPYKGAGWQARADRVMRTCVLLHNIARDLGEDDTAVAARCDTS